MYLGVLKADIVPADLLYQGLVCPEIPEQIHRRWDVDEDAVVDAFDESEDAYPIPMDVK